MARGKGSGTRRERSPTTPSTLLPQLPFATTTQSQWVDGWLDAHPHPHSHIYMDMDARDDYDPVLPKLIGPSSSHGI